ncbi:dymeclin isoform X1 [Brachionus plicatilis]|uniref:Dymeclin n=1 Tax=Brachionus plicatilis TaxID=10195 RepID=A0A3M7P6L7_BRAPC|nr:dymeclin isoform X1 [Brachionus plicatilis]
MGAEFSSLDQLSKNDYINRLVNDEHIDENDPFWNQLLSFTINIPLTKESSKKLDESIALSCQKFHQNNPKSGNYSSLIRVFSRRSNETRRMIDNKLMVLHTSNALFIIRCITKYMIEIENEAVLLEQINFRPDEFKAESEKNPELNGDGLKNQNDYSTDSSTASPKRIYNPNKNYRMWKSRPSHESTLLDSQENSMGYESDSDAPQNVDRSESNAKNTENILYLLIKSILQLCTEIPVKRN